MNSINFHFIVSENQKAQNLFEILKKQYGSVSVEDATHVIVLGGDGTMLQTLHKFLGSEKKIYGINCGTVGFMMNTHTPSQDLCKLIAESHDAILHPLRMTATDQNGDVYRAHAINEVHLFRQTHQTAKIEILINGQTEMDCLVSDGVLVSTALGSTAYNYSAHGPILPLSSNLLALTPLNPFRPRRWRGALLMNDRVIEFKIQNPQKRPVSAVADNQEVRHVHTVEVIEDRNKPIHILYNQNDNLEEKILSEQFRT